MLNLRITQKTLTDQSATYAVEFEATHADNTLHTVTVECVDKAGALRVHEALNEGGSFAHTAAV